MSEATLHDLETRGFVVIREFFTHQQCAALREDFERGSPPSAYPHGFKLLGRAATAAAWARIEPFLADVRAQTKLDVDTLNFLTLSHYITTSLVERTSYLHQDFDLDYQLTGDHVNYLNFWIPIAKPDRERSNVTVIPFDALRARAPAAYECLAGSGGHRLVPVAGRTEVFGNYGDVIQDAAALAPELVIDANLEDIAETPSLDRGDLLLMRGDVVHRTQDASTARVAASIRVTSSAKVIKRDRLRPARPQEAGSNIHRMIERCFAERGGNEIAIRDFVEFARGPVRT
jgi:hypothetical protein